MTIFKKALTNVCILQDHTDPTELHAHLADTELHLTGLDCTLFQQTASHILQDCTPLQQTASHILQDCTPV